MMVYIMFRLLALGLLVNTPLVTMVKEVEVEHQVTVEKMGWMGSRVILLSFHDVQGR